MDAVATPDVRRNAYGQAVWSCPANAGDKPRVKIPGRRWQPAGSPGRARSSRKPIAQGVPGDFGVPVLSLRASFLFARKAVGASCTRHSLRPPAFSEGQRFASPGRFQAAGLRSRVSPLSFPAHAGNPVFQRHLGSSTAASAILGRPVPAPPRLRRATSSLGRRSFSEDGKPDDDIEYPV